MQAHKTSNGQHTGQPALLAYARRIHTYGDGVGLLVVIGGSGGGVIVVVALLIVYFPTDC